MANSKIKSPYPTYGMGTAVALTQNVSYTCPTNGIFYVSCSNLANRFVYGYVNNKQVIGIGTPTGQNSENNCYASLYVKKGWAIKFYGTVEQTTRGYFLPEIEV